MNTTTTARLKCVVCRQAIRGTYITNHWKFPFHSYHSTCSACGYPTAEHKGEPLCRTCRATVVIDLPTATTRARGVRRLLEVRGVDVGMQTIRYGLARVPNPGHSSLGVTRSTWLRAAQGTTSRIEVAIKRGLPGLLFDAVVAHELTHVWLRVHHITPTSIVEEGVAELTAFWLLGRHGSRHAAALQYRIATNLDRTYGAGFRSALKAERRHGWPAVAAALLSTATLPR